MHIRRDITLVLVMIALAGLLGSSGSALAGSMWGDHPSLGPGAPWAPPKGKAVNDEAGPTNQPGSGSPWGGNKPGQGKAQVDDPGSTSQPGSGSPWGGNKPGQGKAQVDDPGPTNQPGSGSPWGWNKSGQGKV